MLLLCAVIMAILSTSTAAPATTATPAATHNGKACELVRTKFLSNSPGTMPVFHVCVVLSHELGLNFVCPD